MRYLGSKRRIAKDILPIILKGRKAGQVYAEPFVGGANLIDKVSGPRMGNDINPYLAALLCAVRDGWQPPEVLTEAEHRAIKANMEAYPPELVAFARFGCSFGGDWFGGYARNDPKNDYAGQSRNSLLKQAKGLKGIRFYSESYEVFGERLPEGAIVYCDPPYAKTTGYKDGDFDSPSFWSWCRAMSERGHAVFISEYEAPEDFLCVWSKGVKVSAENTSGEVKTATERLFVYEPLLG